MTSNSDMFGWAILAATFLGPAFAVLATRIIDARRELNNRRLHVFRTLMATRRAQLTAEHVTALNLIEIDFQGKKEVLQAWKVYFENLCVDTKNESRRDRAWQERPALLAKLLHAIAKVLGYSIEQLDIMAGGYTPQGFFDEAQAQRDLRALTAEVLSGKRPLIIKATAEESVFRPPVMADDA
jgi:hypothetical protein